MSLHITSLSSNCPHKLAYKNNHYNLHGSVLQNFPVETSMAENLTKLFEFNTSVLTTREQSILTNMRLFMT